MDDDGWITLWLLGLVVGMLFLGGLTLDLWRVVAERRELTGLADAAAAAGAAAVHEAAFYDDQSVRLDAARAEQFAWDNLAQHALPPSVTAVRVTGAEDAVTVELAARVEFTLVRVLLPRAAPVALHVTARSAPRPSD